MNRLELSGVYDTHKKNNKIDVSNCQTYENKDMAIYVVTDSMSDITKIIAEKYPLDGASCAGKIQALFIAMIEDKHSGKISIFNDLTSSMLNMYFTLRDNQVFYSTSLKWVLSNSKCSRELNEIAAAKFIKNGCIQNEETLVKNVFKLKENCELIIDGSNIEQRNYGYSFDEVDRNTAKKQLISTLQKNIVECIDDNEDAVIPLSNGFDSNLIMHTLLQRQKNIKAFTIGGKTGRNEIEAVRNNVEGIKQVELNTVLVDNIFLENLTDIVWRLEGALFERGIILQYALAKTLKEAGADSLICGEYADQILSCKYVESIQDKKVEENPYTIGNLIILKKSGIMLNSFGIIGRYPFTRQNIIPLSLALRKDNGTDKVFYKKECKKIFTPKIAKSVKKVGGSTYNSAILSENNYTELKNIADNSELIKQIEYLALEEETQSEKDEKSMNRRDVISYLLRNYGFTTLLKKVTVRAVAKIKRNDSTERVESNERKYNEVLAKIYLLAFNELFIKSKEINVCEEVPVSLTELLKSI